MPKSKDISNDEHLFLPVNLGKVTRPFPNNLEPINLKREISFTSGKRSKQLSILPGLEVPASSPQGQPVERPINSTGPGVLHVKVHFRTTEKRLSEYDLFGFSEESLFSLEKNVAPEQTTEFLKQRPRDRRGHETSVEMFAHNAQGHLR